MSKTLNKIKLQYQNNGLIATLSYLFITVFLNKIGVEINFVFVLPNSSNNKPEHFNSFTTYESIPEASKQQIQDELGSQYAKKIARKFRNNETLFIGYIDDNVASTSWIKQVTQCDKMPFENYFLLYADFTRPVYRGRGLHKSAISYRVNSLAETISSETPAIIESSITNHASIKNIIKCGFKKIGIYISYRDKVLYSSFK
jgi:hypothetical protein